jgi:hypothetical protein
VQPHEHVVDVLGEVGRLVPRANDDALREVRVPFEERRDWPTNCLIGRVIQYAIASATATDSAIPIAISEPGDLVRVVRGDARPREEDLAEARLLETLVPLRVLRVEIDVGSRVFQDDPLLLADLHLEEFLGLQRLRERRVLVLGVGRREDVLPPRRSVGRIRRSATSSLCSANSS